MYGTVAYLRLKPDAEPKLQELSREFEKLQIPGYLFEYVYRLDSDPTAGVLVAGFASKETYLANANSPEQHARYLQYRALLEADPEWHDGEIVYAYPAHGQENKAH